MPELPEVETVRLGLAKLLLNKVIKSVSYDWPKSFPNAKADVDKFLIGAQVLGVGRRAKVLVIELNTKYSLLVHLKMTGQLVFVGRSPNLNRDETLHGAGEARAETYGQPKDGVQEPATQQRASSSRVTSSISKQADVADGVRFGAGHPSNSLVGKLPDKSTRVVFTFSDGSRLFFNDQRKFGWVKLLATAEVPRLDFIKKLGPEPLADGFTYKQFSERLSRRPGTNIKAALIDQTVIAGVGNIYADEALWGAKIYPTTPVKNISEQKRRLLLDELKAVLLLSIEKGGSTDRNYVNAEGKKGSYINFARVFRKDGQPCPRCGTIIKKIRVAGRGTHICPVCQKI